MPEYNFIHCFVFFKRKCSVFNLWQKFTSKSPSTESEMGYVHCLNIIRIYLNKPKLIYVWPLDTKPKRYFTHVLSDTDQYLTIYNRYKIKIVHQTRLVNVR